ncbi:hypothetical protein [Chryseobacterium sp. WX]|uniref:hypothetical protein n=1 Tax=Chryseobacterium sp. WX TaxID=3031803 RepID=UPI002409E6D8|nr:hypothetical protein [Chryseobacterium sp. WX]WFB67021.1 hypothetical protein PZ898_20255 [Chryseobacterium sp. WX]
MEYLETKERLKIIVSISDRLWDDYKSGIISPDEYLIKSDDLRDELNKISDVTFFDMQEFSNKIGYLLVRTQNIFGSKKNYEFSLLVFN